jgi:Glycosyltransferase family 87
MADSAFLRALRDGAWLSESRLKAYPWILLAGYLLAAVLYVATSHGLIDLNGKPLGPDFIDVYAAGKMALNGHAPAVYNWAQHHMAEKAVFGGREIPYFGWHYPPLFLLLAAPLALLPYAWSLVLYLAATFAGYAAVIWRAVNRERVGLMLAFAFPAVFVNAFHGQNGFLTTALLGGGLLLLDESPWLAGILLGCLAYKPQLAALALLLPLVTLRWRVVASAAATIAALSLLTAALFGMETWQAFLNSATLTRTIVLEAGSTGWEKIQSVFAGVRMLGGGVALAYALQGVVATAAIAATIWAWRSKIPYIVQCAVLCLATMLVTPYLLDYDLVLLALPIAWLALEGWTRSFLPWEKITLFLLWVLPLVSREAGSLMHIPLGPPVLILGLTLALRRAWRARTPYGIVA